MCFCLFNGGNHSSGKGGNVVCQLFPFFSLKKIFQMILKHRAAFLKSRRFFGHPYLAISDIATHKPSQTKSQNQKSQNPNPNPGLGGFIITLNSYRRYRRYRYRRLRRVLFELSYIHYSYPNQI